MVTTGYFSPQQKTVRFGSELGGKAGATGGTSLTIGAVGERVGKYMQDSYSCQALG